MKAEELRVRLWQKRFISTGDSKAFEKVWIQVRNMVQAPYAQFPECSKGHWDSIKMEAILDGLNTYNAKHIVVTQQVVERETREEEEVFITVPKLVTLPSGESKIVKVRRPVKVLGEAKTKLEIVTTERESEMTLLSFLRFKMEQAIRAEKRDLIAQRRNLALDDTYADDQDHTRADEICFNRMSAPTKLYPKDPEQQEEAYQALIRAVEARLEASGDPKILRAFRLRLSHPAITNRKIAATLELSKTYTSSYFRKLQKIIEEVIEETDTLLT